MRRCMLTKFITSEFCCSELVASTSQEISNCYSSWAHHVIEEYLKIILIALCTTNGKDVAFRSFETLFVIIWEGGAFFNYLVLNLLPFGWSYILYEYFALIN